MGWGELYNDRFKAMFGKDPERHYAYLHDGYRQAIQILEYPDNGTLACCTFGLSHFRNEVENICEVFMDVDTANVKSSTQVGGILAYCA